jgi:hypothetical protein
MTTNACSALESGPGAANRRALTPFRPDHGLAQVVMRLYPIARIRSAAPTACLLPPRRFAPTRRRASPLTIKLTATSFNPAYVRSASLHISVCAADLT